MDQVVKSGAEQAPASASSSGGTTYFAHVDGLAPEDVERAADEAAAALRVRALASRSPCRGGEVAPLPIERRPEEVPAERKAEMLRELDERGRAPRAARSPSSPPPMRRRGARSPSPTPTASSPGTTAPASASAPRPSPGATATVETGAETLGAHRGFELLEDDPGQIAEQAAGKALTLLDATPAPSGSMPVVVGGGFGGVLFHEMTGHGLEADHIQKSASVYTGKLGEKVAEPLLNAYDDGRLPGEWGSDAIDDEGRPTQKTQVIEGGRLTSYLYDHLTADRDGVASTGNGRRESFRHLPIPRMTNTYIAPGDVDSGGDDRRGRARLLRGLLRRRPGRPATGDFVFGVSEGYLIEGGKVTRPCRGATLIGNCLEALAAIDAVGDDFFMKTGICGKGGQKVPVGTGQGHVRVRAMTVGGTEHERAERHRAPRGRSGDRRRRQRRRGLRFTRQRPRGAGPRGEIESLTAATQTRRRDPGLDRQAGRLRLRHRPLRVGHRRHRGQGGRGGAGRRRGRVRGSAAAGRVRGPAGAQRPFRGRMGDRAGGGAGADRGAHGAGLGLRAWSASRPAVYADSDEQVAIASSTGVAGEYETSSCYAYLQALAEGEGGARDRPRVRPRPRPPRSRPGGGRRRGRPTSPGDDRRRQAQLALLSGRGGRDRRCQLRRPDRRRPQRQGGAEGPLAASPGA